MKSQKRLRPNLVIAYIENNLVDVIFSVIFQHVNSATTEVKLCCKIVFCYTIQRKWKNGLKTKLADYCREFI